MPSPIFAPVSFQAYTRRITAYSPGLSADGAAGDTSLSVPWPTFSGSVTANVRNYLTVALKPGTANGGSVATPSGWTLVGSHIGGGYGGTLGTGTGNCRVYLFVKDNDNTSSGSLSVSITPDGSNGVASACIGRIEKNGGAWQSIATSTAEAVLDVTVGDFVPSPAMQVAPGDFLVYGWAISPDVPGTASLSAGSWLSTTSPSTARGGRVSVGNQVSLVSTCRRAMRGYTIGTQQLTTVAGNCRGPMIVARMRVR